MIGRAREIGGFRNSDYVATTGVTSYVGGTAACMTTGGTVDALSGTTDLLTGDTAYLGVFANAKGIDQKSTTLSEYTTSGSGSGSTFASTALYKATIITGPALLRLQSGTKDGVSDGYPYLTTDSWVASDKLYLTGSGQWTRTKTGTGLSGSVARGVVLAVGATYLDVLLW